MRDDMKADADEETREQLERSDEVAASAEPQGDGVPDEGTVTAATAPESGAARELAEMHDKYLRLAAEFDNYRKRTMRERQETSSRAQAELVKRIVEVIDDLDRVSQLDPKTNDTASVIDGVELVERKLLKTLVTAGLEVIDPSDQTFNPESHEAITTVPALSAEDDNTVAQVYQLGYRFGGVLLRPARVVVKQWNG